MHENENLNDAETKIYRYDNIDQKTRSNQSSHSEFNENVFVLINLKKNKI